MLSEENEIKKNTNKVLDAKGKGVPIVEENFIHDSCKKKKLQNIKKYTLVVSFFIFVYLVICNNKRTIYIFIYF